MVAAVAASKSGANSSGVKSPLELIILDVGHGNCTIVRDGDVSCIIDLPKGREIVDAIIENGCSKIKHLILSHPDEDHIGGAARILADEDVSIENFWCNASAVQDTETYLDLLEQAALREEAGETRYRNNLNLGARNDLDFGRVGIEILHPGIVHAGVGQTKKGHKLGKITGNGMSVVLRVKLDGCPVALLAADIDSAGLKSIIERGPALDSHVLVFPHHGGATGGRDEFEFARSICELVSPQVVVFSLGRSRFSNPLKEILDGVKAAVPSAHIACTQLSKRCHDGSLSLPEAERDRLSWPSKGTGHGICCAGTLIVRKVTSGIAIEPSTESHSAFVGMVDDAQCLIPLARTPD